MRRCCDVDVAVDDGVGIVGGDVRVSTVVMMVVCVLFTMLTLSEVLIMMLMHHVDEALGDNDVGLMRKFGFSPPP